MSGCVPRLKLEHWLNQECRSLIMLLDGATLLGLLDRHSYGGCSGGGGRRGRTASSVFLDVALVYLHQGPLYIFGH